MASSNTARNDATLLGSGASEACRMGKASWLSVLRRYAVWTVLAHLIWEVLHLPLYTIWREESLWVNGFAVLHCTAGDLLIAGAALALALVVSGTSEWPVHRFGRVVFVATLIGVGYTIYSEWLNTEIRAAWAYTDAKPVVPGLGTGLTPLGQWMLLPPLGMWIARRGKVQ